MRRTGSNEIALDFDVLEDAIDPGEPALRKIGSEASVVSTSGATQPFGVAEH